METPRAYSVQEVLQLGKNESFTSQIQFEASVKSHLDSATAYADLLPRFSLGDVMTLATATITPTVIIGLIGDLAPFLIPSNWMKAQGAHWQSNADYYAWLLMRANSGTIAEGMAYAYLRDKTELESIKTYEQPITQIRDYRA